MEKRGKSLLVLLGIIFFLFALMPLAYSLYEEIVYAGTIDDGGKVIVKGSTFLFKIDSVSSKIYAEVNLSGMILQIGECKINGNFDICPRRINISYRNHTTYTDVYKVTVDIYQIKSKLDISSSIDIDNLMIGEKAAGEVALENIADITAEGATAVIILPKSVLVTSYDGCKKSGDALVLQEDIHPRQIKKCRYELQALAQDDFKLNANLTYFDGIESVNKISNTLNIKISSYELNITPIINKSRMEIGDKRNLTFRIKNVNSQYAVDVTNFNIKLPEGITILKKPSDTSGTDKIRTWTGDLAPKQEKNFTLELEGRVTGNHSVMAEALYKVEGFTRIAKNTTNLEVYCDCPFLSHELSKNIVEPKQKTRIKAIMVNPSPEHEFKNIKVKYSTNMPRIQDFSTAHAAIRPYENIGIFDSEIIGPDFGEVYYLNFTVYYESSANEIFVVRDNIALKLNVNQSHEGEAGSGEDEKNLPGVQGTANGTAKPAINTTDKEDSPITTTEGHEKMPIKQYVIVVSVIIFIIILFLVIKAKRKGYMRAY
jgi:hypothetical protein